MWRGSRLLAEEAGVLHTMRYEPGDLRSMLGDAGFADVTIEGRYTGREADSDDTTIVAVARRPMTGEPTLSRTPPTP